MAERESTASSRTAILVVVGAVIAALYFAREILIPFALALLLSFLLAPMVVRLRNLGLGKIASVLCVVTLAFAILAVIGGLVTIQLNDLAHRLPQYQQNVHQKLQGLRASSSGLINHLSRTVQEFTQILSPSNTPGGAAPGEEKPVPVEIRPNPFSPLGVIQTVLGSLISILLTTVIVVVFVIFMLFQRGDLRDRLIRLVGSGQLNMTTRALDEAGSRVSRYLLAQLGINAAYGLLAGIGLHGLGVPNPVLWGVLAALFRYVPYLGIWIAAVMPAAVAVAVSPGWLKPVAVFGLYFGIDLLMYNFVEPPLYGTSAGISPMAILAAAVFWTWLWGPVGLLLSTPLTVCVVVIGRYVPQMEFLTVLLGDETVLGPRDRIYQRLAARNLNEAIKVAESFLENKSLQELYDEVLIPVVCLAESDRRRGRFYKSRGHRFMQDARSLVEAVGAPGAKPERSAGAATGTVVVCFAGPDGADEVAALMLSRLLVQGGVAAKVLPLPEPESGARRDVNLEGVNVACAVALPPPGRRHTLELGKKMRAAFPALKIVIATPGPSEAQPFKEPVPEMRADALAMSLGKAVHAALSLASEPAPREPAPAGHGGAAQA